MESVKIEENFDSKISKKKPKSTKKEEKRRYKEELERKIKRDQFLREMEIQAKIRYRLDEQFKKIMIANKLPNMIGDIKMASRKFDRVCAFKDNELMYLMNCIDDQEEIYRRFQGMNCETIEMLLDIFTGRCEDMCRENMVIIESLCCRQESERHGFRGEQRHDELHLNAMLYQMNNSIEEITCYVKGEYMVKLEEEDGKFKDICDSMKLHLENQFCEMWNAFAAIMKGYTEKNKRTRKPKAKIKKKDDEMRLLILNQRNQILKYESVVRKMRSKLFFIQYGKKIVTIRKSYQRYKDSHNKFRRQLAHEKRRDEQHMINLSETINEVIKKLQQKRDKGERALRIIQLARPHETHWEKLINIVHQKHSEHEEFDETELDAFWRRVAEADASRYALMEEKQNLITENSLLKHLLAEKNDYQLMRGVPH